MTAEEDRLWGAVRDGLDRLGDGGRTVDFWLRDDDAVAPGAALGRLIGIAADAGAPLALAVIPARAGAGLADALAPLEAVSVLQHGLAHADHGAAGAKKSELGPERPVERVLADIAEGWARLCPFARRQPVLVPPWNRIAAPVAARLPSLGFKALSAYGDRDPSPSPSLAPATAPATAGLLRLNAHVDPVAWRTHRGFVGRTAALTMLAERLGRLLDGRADRAEPTGILTHHLVHDEATFAFLAELLGTLGNHDAGRWLSVQTLLGLGVPGERDGAA